MQVNNARIRKLAVAMNKNLAVSRYFHKNPLHYQQFYLRELRIVRVGRAFISLDTIFLCRPYVTTMKAIQLNDNFPALLVDDFQDHNLPVFD